ncbi:MAG: hypothetical protein V7607_18 [Solirubrobacteraceae bacterium]
MFGIPFLAAWTMSSRVEEAVATHRLDRATPRVAGPEEIDAQLDAAMAEIVEVLASRRGLPEFEEAVAHACARAEEWTA